MKDKKYAGLKIGAIFSAVSFLLTFTIAIPMFSVIPAIALEQLIMEAAPGISYAGACKIMLSIITALLLITALLTAKNIKRSASQGQERSPRRIMLTLLTFYLFVHPTGYYILMWFSDFPIDALNAIVSLGSFPFTSLSFVLIGFLMDRYWLRYFAYPLLN